MKYSIITFDDSTFYNARLTNNDMVCIERYIRKNPLTMFSELPMLSDLAFILYMSLREYTDYSLDDIYDIIDSIEMSVEELTEIVVQLFRDMGYAEDVNNTKKVVDEVQDNGPKIISHKNEEIKSFKRTADDILEQYLIVGSAEEFWDSNLDEVAKAFDMYKKQLRSRGESDYVLALMFSTNIGLMLNGKTKKMPKVEEYFPGLYSKEELEERERDERTRKAIENLNEFGNRFNERKRARELLKENKK